LKFDQDKNMEGKSARITTKDGLKLQGILCYPKKKTSNSVVLHIHGLEGNFYENEFFDDLAEVVTESNFTFCAVNTRGAGTVTDFVTNKPGNYKKYGAAYELVNHCLIDIAAWIDFLAKEAGFKNIILSGHSLGTIKVAYYLSQTQDKRVKGLILLAAVDYCSLEEKQAGKKFEKYLKKAEAMIKRGEGKNFVPQDWHFLTFMSAESYYDWFKKNSKARIFEFSKPSFTYPQLSSIKIPVLILQGEKDQYIEDPQKSLDLISSHTQTCTPILVKNADHWYNGGIEQMKQTVKRWLINL